jgi:hypothetical protein
MSFLVNPNVYKNGLPVSATSITKQYIVGDSISLNSTGSGASSGGNMYANSFAAQHSLTVTTNQAVGARGTWNQTAAIQNAAWDNLTLTTVQVGLNDMKRNGVAGNTLNKILGQYRAMALKMIKSTSIAAGSSSCTRSGTVLAYGANTVGGLYPTGTLPGNFGIFLNAVNSYVEHTFTGTGIGFQFIGADNSLYNEGQVDVHIDGNLVDHINLGTWMDGITDGANDNGRGPIGWYWFGLSGGSHTIRITQTHANPCPIDFFTVLTAGTMNNRGAMFNEIPYCTATGYLSPAFGSIAASDACSLKIRQVVLEMRAQGYNFGFAPVNSFYNPVNSADGTHPNDTGHQQIKAAMNSVYI